ncbi:uncharacterized protein LOC128092340 [Culex pipiens pallens]|uniref:uncharacterized protein LOC128092340 n=1 Tax=Culex pipiens pallens TaxID=42434 RepID=UPI0022AA863C|nr:uncharacterized protein LOC128092340 [Culex pipiens pallens]
MIDTDVRYLGASLSDSSLAGASLVEAHVRQTPSQIRLLAEILRTLQADGLLVEATPLKSILEVKVGGQPPGLLAVRESAQGTCQLVARRWKSARSTTRARCTGLSTSIRVVPPPTSPNTRRTCTIAREVYNCVINQE